MMSYLLKSVQRKMIKLIGTFQVLTADIVIDRDFNPHLIDVNTKLKYSNKMRAHKYLIPQILQSTLDIILEANMGVQNGRKVWKNTELINWGRWKMLYNQANGYDVL